MIADVPIFSIQCSNKSDPSKCLLYLGYGFVGEPEAGTNYERMMVCFHCECSTKTFQPAFIHRRKFGIKTGHDCKKLGEFGVKSETADDLFLEKVKKHTRATA